MARIHRLIFLIFVPIALTACANGIELGPPKPDMDAQKEVGIFGEGGLRIGAEGGIQTGKGGLLDAITGMSLGSSTDTAQPVNRYLWRGAVDTLSAILPIASIDAASGVVATDWGNVSPQMNNERVRATAIISSPQLAARSLEVSVFREGLSPMGVWQPSTVDPSTAIELKNAILTRARQLRIAEDS